MYHANGCNKPTAMLFRGIPYVMLFEKLTVDAEF